MKSLKLQFKIKNWLARLHQGFVGPRKKLWVLVLILAAEIGVLGFLSAGFPVMGVPERVFVTAEGEFLFQTLKGTTFKGYFGDRADPGRHRLRLERAGAVLELSLQGDPLRNETSPLAQDPVLAEERPGQDRVLETATPSARLLRLQAEAEARLSQERQQLSTQAGQLLGEIEAGVRDITSQLATISSELSRVQTQSAQIEAAVTGLVGRTFISVEKGEEILKTSEVLPGADLNQQLVKEGIRQKIVFNTPPPNASLRFSLNLEGLAPSQNEAGNWRFLNQSGRPLLSLSQPVLEDAAGAQGAVTMEILPPTTDHQSPITNHQLARRSLGEGGSLLITIDPSWLSSPARTYPVTLKQDILAILLGLTAAKETFTALEELVFDFEYWPEDGPVPPESIKPTLLTSNGQTIPVGAQIEKLAEGKYRLRFPPPRTLRAGRHTLRLEYEQAGNLKTAEQDFSWGVLAINVDKSIYLPGEEAYLQMAVLGEAGNTICDAQLKLKVSAKGGSAPGGKSSKLKVDELSTEDGSIDYSDECSGGSVTYTPDYFAYYQVGGPGVYQLELTAETANGRHTITDSFEVRDSVPFDIVRYGPTRIYPPEPYSMKLTIKANQDFEGEIKESVPADFTITGQEGMILSSEGSTKELAWEVNLSAGQTKQLTYEFDAPDTSPAFYLLGPVELTANNRQQTTKALSVESGQSEVAKSPTFAEIRRWQIAADAFGNGYTYRRLIDITDAQVSGGPHTNFPILFSATIADLKTTANGGDVTDAEGDDIIFTDSDGSTQFSHEIEKYVATTGELIAWVRVPSLAATSTLYIYYGNSSVTTFQGSVPGSVWDADYMAVWHLDEDAAGTGNIDLYQDSTSNVNHADDYVSATGKTGQIDGGQQFDGTDDYAHAPTSASLDIIGNQITIDAWVRLTSTFNSSSPNDMTIIDGGGKIEYWFDAGTGKVSFSLNTGGWVALLSTQASWTGNTWYHLVAVYNGTNRFFYVDGSQNNSSADTGNLAASTFGIRISQDPPHPTNEGTFNGEIDEVRISDVARSAGWVQTSFNNQDSPSGFYAVGDEETSGPTNEQLLRHGNWFSSGVEQTYTF